MQTVRRELLYVRSWRVYCSPRPGRLQGRRDCRRAGRDVHAAPHWRPPSHEDQLPRRKRGQAASRPYGAAGQGPDSRLPQPGRRGGLGQEQRPRGGAIQERDSPRHLPRLGSHREDLPHAYRRGPRDQQEATRGVRPHPQARPRALPPGARSGAQLHDRRRPGLVRAKVRRVVRGLAGTCWAPVPPCRRTWTATVLPPSPIRAAMGAVALRSGRKGRGEVRCGRARGTPPSLGARRPKGRWRGRLRA